MHLESTFKYPKRIHLQVLLILLLYARQEEVSQVHPLDMLITLYMAIDGTQEMRQ